HKEKARYGRRVRMESDALNSRSNGVCRCCRCAADESIRIACVHHCGCKIHRALQALLRLDLGNTSRFPIEEKRFSVTLAQLWRPWIDNLDMRQLDPDLLCFLFHLIGRTDQNRSDH